MDGDCNGCMITHVCDFVMNNTTEDCPCKLCLVKMVCFETCPEFGERYKEIMGFYPSKHKGY